MKQAPKLIPLLALGLLFLSVAPVQAQWSRLQSGLYDSESSDYIQRLQVEIFRLEREIWTIQQYNRFRWFNRWELIDYHNYMYQRRLEVGQLRFQLVRDLMVISSRRSKSITNRQLYFY